MSFLDGLFKGGTPNPLDQDLDANGHKVKNLAAPVDPNDAARLVDVAVGSVPGSRIVAASTGLTGGGDLSANRAFAVLYGTTAGTSAQGNDSRLSDARTPTAHATSHKSGGTDAVKLDELAAPTDITTLDASSSAHGLMPKADGDPLHFYSSDGTQKTPGVGGVQVWYPDAPPVSPNAVNDEFTANALDAKWLVFDPSSILTTGIDTTKRMGKLQLTGNGSIRWAGIYQALPAAECALYAKVFLNYVGSVNGASCGLMIAESLASSPGTKKFATMERIALTPAGITRCRDWATYNAGSATATITQNNETVYLRVRVNGTTIYNDFSIDGVSWMQMGTHTLGFTPADCGFVCNAGDAASLLIAYIKFFRVFVGAGSSGIDATQIGRYL